VGQKLKFGWPVIRIKEEIFDWHYAHKRGWSNLVKRSKRQLKDWVYEGERRLRGKGGTDDQRLVLWLHTTLGRRLIEGKLGIATGYEIAGRGKKKRVTKAFEQFAAAQGALYELSLMRDSDEYRAFLANQEQLDAVPAAYAEASDKLQVGRRIAALLSSNLYQMLRASSTPPAGVTDRQWRRWREAADAAEKVMAEVERVPGWTRMTLVERARLTTGSAPTDPAVELEEAVLRYRDRPGPVTADRLQRAVVRARSNPELAFLVADGEALLALSPPEVALVAIEPWYVRYRWPLAGAAILTAAGLVGLTTTLRKGEVA
jgi:hypothetical protein